MKIIIDIPEEVYKKAKETHDVMCDKVWLGIKYGTPLDDVKAEIHKANCYYHGTEYGEGIDLCEKIIDKHIGKAESEEN